MVLFRNPTIDALFRDPQDFAIHILQVVLVTCQRARQIEVARNVPVVVLQLVLQELQLTLESLARVALVLQAIRNGAVNLRLIPAEQIPDPTE